MATNMINDIESTDIKASYTVSRVLWTLLDTVFAGDNEEDALNLYDKELLDDILRFGTIAEVARRKGEPYNSVRTKVVHSLERLEKKIKWIETKEHQLRHDLENANSLLKVKDKKLNDQKLQLIEKMASIHQLQAQLSEERKNQQQWNEKEQELEEQIDTLKQKLLTSTHTIIDLRQINGKIQQSLNYYKVKVEKLKESEAQLQNTVNAQDHQLKNALAKHNGPSEREAALKRRIASLENLVEYYKKAKFSSNIESPENTPSEYGKEAIMKEED